MISTGAITKNHFVIAATTWIPKWPLATCHIKNQVSGYMSAAHNPHLYVALFNLPFYIYSYIEWMIFKSAYLSRIYESV